MNPGDEALGPPATSARGRWQLGLRGVILLVVAAALASSIAANRRRVAELKPRIDRLRPLARELEVADPRRLAAIQQMRDEYGEEAWLVHVPAGRDHRLCLATRGIGESNSVAPTQWAPIGPGRHVLRLAIRPGGQGNRLDILDGSQRRLTIEESEGWAESGGSSSNAVGATTIQVPVDRPLVLLRRRFMKPIPDNPQSSRLPDGPSDGIMLWVEPAGAGRDSSGPR